jgi:hypothetical protein
LAILRLGRRRFGPPGDGLCATIDAIDDIDQLNTLLDRILEVASWDELLKFPNAPV